MKAAGVAAQLKIKRLISNENGGEMRGVSGGSVISAAAGMKIGG